MSVTFEIIEPKIALIKIDRPHVHNALNWDGMAAFAGAVEQAHRSPGLKAVILTGAGESFCSGGDLKELAGYETEADGRRLAESMGGALQRLEELPVPTIAVLNGPARGGGAEIALACDLRVMAQTADLGLMHIRIGISPAWGGGQRLLQMVGYSRALEWLATGRILTAADAYAHGLANRITPDGESLSTALEIARQIANHASAALEAIKAFLRAGVPHSIVAAELEREAFPRLWAAPEHHRLVERFFNRKKARV